TADAGLLVAAEGGAGRDHVVGVHPHTAGLHGAGHPQGTVDVLGPHGAAQTIDGVVGHGDDLFLGLELDDHGHGAKDLLLGHPHVVVGVDDKGGLHEGAVGAGTLLVGLAATGDGGALFLGQL